jgi:hypothetical protein
MTALRFDAQDDLEGLPPLPRVTLGYRLNQLETEVEGVYVLYSVNNTPCWWYRIGDEGQGLTGAETIPLFPVAPIVPTGATGRVTPKKRPEEEGTKVIPLFGSGQD